MGWYRSFYWRIGVSFVVLVVVVLTAQSAWFNYIMARTNRALPGRSPNSIAAIVAADLGSALTQEPGLEIKEYFQSEYGQLQMPVRVIMKDGREAANTSQTLRDDLRQSIEAILTGADVLYNGRDPIIGGPPTVTSPIQVNGELRGMVIVLPTPQRSPVARDVSRLLSVPGTAVLVIATAIAALVIFAPARRRLKDLEDASERFGKGDLTARASEHGGDEIARVAASFNRMASDLSAREEALRTSDRLRRQMLADVSHELKTPLTAMRGYIETLRMPGVVADAATRERYFDTVERETLRLDRMVKDLLDLARLENGVGELDARWFAIARVFDQIVRRHEVEAQTARVTLTTRVADGADQLFGDPDRLEQVVDNLVVNALRHTPAGGRVEITAATRGQSAVVSVADSGTGIAADHLPHIFERFYKVDAARTNGPQGSGLGLSIAKAIVERHGGTIQVASVPGRTVFTVVLPRPDVDATVDQSTSTNL
jgi:two-component system sensor histidine kinase BaeS